MAASSTFVFPENMVNSLKLNIIRKIMNSIQWGFPGIASISDLLFRLGTLISSAQVKDPLNYAERLSIYAGLQGIEK